MHRQTPALVPPRRASSSWVSLWLATLLCAGPAAAQPQPVAPPPVIEAVPLESAPPVGVLPVPSIGTVTPATTDAIAQAFVEGCVAHEGQLAATVDWALSQGFEPHDELAPESQTLLEGQAGTVLAMPGGAARVYLVVMAGQRCIVWAEGAMGPALHEAFLLGLDRLASKTGKVEKVLERNIDRGGTWRRQLQLRYRRAGGAQDFGIDAVTTLNDQPGVQAFHLAPLSQEARTDPDGMPR